MDQEIAVVEQHPLRSGLALDVERAHAVLAQASADSRLRWVDSTAHPASASEIRRRLAAGEALPDGWLDPRVLAFATKYDLYRACNQ